MFGVVKKRQSYSNHCILSKPTMSSRKKKQQLQEVDTSSIPSGDPQMNCVGYFFSVCFVLTFIVVVGVVTAFFLRGGGFDQDTVDLTEGCVDTQNNPFHCGTCGTRCPGMFVCEQGRCVCPVEGVSFVIKCQDITPEGLHVLECVDSRVSSDHCGACYTPCNVSGGELCIDSVCVVPP